MTNKPYYIVSFTDPGDEWIACGEGLSCNAAFIGPMDPSAPGFTIVRASRDVGDRIAGTRTHPTALLTVVLEGEMQLDGTWMAPGEIQLVPAGVPHGDIVIGPEGVVFATMFASRSGMIPQFIDPGDQDRFDQMLRADVEEVATGKTERPVAILPPRPTYTPRRGVKVTDPDLVRELLTKQLG